MADLEECPNFTKLYYPVGNTPPADVTLGCHVPSQCDILLLGCGDIRNVLYTIHVLSQNDISSDQVINFHLNDNEEGIITRDLILFNIVKTVNPDDEADMNFLWSVWYDVLMSREHLDRLRGVMKNLTKHTSGDQNIYLGNEATEHSVKNTLYSWTKHQHETENVLEKRHQYLKVKYTEKQEECSTKRIASRFIDQSHLSMPTEEKLRDRCIQEVHEYTDFGVTRINATNKSRKQILSSFCSNVTFFRPDNTEWTVPDDSSPFLCYDFETVIERYDGAKQTMAKLFCQKLKEWVKSFQAVEKQCSLKIYLWLDDAKTLCEENLSEDQTFDFIDTSTLADETGIMFLLVTLQGRLRHDTGVLKTETFDWFHCMSHGEHFLRLCVDIPPMMYPTVLGVHLAEELKIGHEHHDEYSYFEGINKLVFRWKKASSFTPVTLTGSDDISSCLETIQSPKPLQSLESFQNVKPATFDNAMKRKLLDRLNKITRNTAAETKTASGDIMEKNEIIIEYNDHYEVKLHLPDSKNIGKLTLKLEESEKRSLTFLLTTGSTTHFSITLRFSCPLSMQNNTITVSKKNSFIHGTLIKDQRLCVGERVLPWKTLTIKDVSALPDYPTSPLSLRKLGISLGFVYPQIEHVTATEKDNPSPQHQLKDVFTYLLREAPVDLHVNMLSVPRRNPKGDTPLELYQTTLVLEDHKLWEGEATTFVTVYDHDAARALIKERKISMEECLAEYIQCIPGAQALNEKLLSGFTYLARILDVNSYRLQQNSVDFRWVMKSFVRTRYPFKTLDRHIKESELEERYMQAGLMTDPVVQMQFLQEMQHTGRLEAFCSPEVQKIHSTVMASFNQVCDSCGKMKDCKRCTACDNAYYCSRTCQRRAWPQHKRNCRK